MKISKSCQITPLKVRGARGVMEVTPCVPLILRGRFGEGNVEGLTRERSSL
jgi:hypothetical protein